MQKVAIQGLRGSLHKHVQKALQTLSDWGYKVDILGSYKKAELPQAAD